jgi:serine/threonine protein kinase
MCYFDRSLEDLKSHVAVFDPISLGKIMAQCIVILESLHELFVVHRDIKPQNFMIRNKQLYLIDYGLATFYVDENGEHLPNKYQEDIIGTPKFLSYNNYLGNTLSRRDDLISLGYLYMYMLFGSLPWQQNFVDDCNDCSNNKLKNQESIISLKSWENMNTYTSNYHNLHEYMKYCYNLDYDEEPDYDFLCNLFTHNVL